MLNWQVVPYNQHQQELWYDWQQLFSQYHAHNPMLDTRFVRSLCQYYHEDLVVAKGYQNKQLVALMLLQQQSLTRWKNYIPSQSQVALILISPAAHFTNKALLTALGGSAQILDLFSLDPQEHQVIIAAQTQKQNYAQNIKLHIQGDFTHYWQERPKRLRKDISKSLNRIKKDNITLSHQAITDVNSVAQAVDRYGMLEAQGWKGKNGTAIHPGNTQGQFYQHLMKEFAQQGQALVYESYIDDHLVASRLCIFNQETLIILKTTFDEKNSYYALGNVNRYQLFDHLFTNKITQCVDFYTNASKEQLYWSTEQRTMSNVTCYRTAIMAQLVAMAHKLKAMIIKRS